MQATRCDFKTPLILLPRCQSRRGLGETLADDEGRGLHGYSHENATQMTIEQQHAILDKTYKQITEFCGKPPRGSVAPWWEASQEGAELMLKYGIEYGA